jgi:hypothetical protein
VAPASTLAHASACLRFVLFDMLCIEAGFVAELENLWRATRTMLPGLKWSTCRKQTWEKLYHCGASVYRHHARTVGAILMVKAEAQSSAPDTKASPMQKRLVDFFQSALTEMAVVSVQVTHRVQLLRFAEATRCLGDLPNPGDGLPALVAGEDAALESEPDHGVGVNVMDGMVGDEPTAAMDAVEELSGGHLCTRGGTWDC